MTAIQPSPLSAVRQAVRAVKPLSAISWQPSWRRRNAQPTQVKHDSVHPATFQAILAIELEDLGGAL